MRNTELKNKLISWAGSNNWGLPHPNDMERFWAFVIEAFESGEDVDHEEFKAELKAYCTDEEIIDEYYFKYENGMELLRCYSIYNEGK